MIKKRGDIRALCLSLEPMYLRPYCEEFVAALASLPELEPTHCGEDDPPIDRFDSGSVEDRLNDDYSSLIYRRGRGTKWWGMSTFFDRGLQRASFEFASVQDLQERERVFEWLGNIASVMRPYFAVIHPKYPAKRKYENWDVAAYLKPRELERNGAGPLCSRNFLGNELLKQIGMDRISAAGCRVVRHDWGAVVDIVEEPWAADVDVLLQRQQEVMCELEPSGVFADYSKWPKIASAPNWIPPDVSVLPPWTPSS